MEQDEANLRGLLMGDLRARCGHGRFLLPLSLLLFLVLLPCAFAQQRAQSSCVKCHLNLGDEMARPVLALQDSIHREKEVACHDCHGGDPAAEDMDAAMSAAKGFRGVPAFDEIPEFCARCHADPIRMKHYNLRTDQFSEYKTSQHGKLLYEKKDHNVATCVSCHGSHDIRSKNDSRSAVFKTNIPQTCANCHSDPKRLHIYGIPTNQYELFVKSAHGERLLVDKDMRAPSCADCHGIHGASPPGFNDIANVCSYCHGKIADHFKEGPHYIGRMKEEGARCINCHGNHLIQRPTTAMYEGDAQGHCGQCHEQGGEAMKVAAAAKQKIDQAILAVSRAREDLEEVRNSGKNLDSLKERFEKASSSLVHSRALAHTLSLEKIEAEVSSVTAGTEKIEEEVHKIKWELQSRKRSVVIVLLILGTIMAVLFIKIKSLGRGSHP